MTTTRKFGLDFVGDIPWGMHLCQFYNTKHDLIDILVPYFAEGLRSNEACVWVTSEPLKEKEAVTALEKVIPDIVQFIEKGQLFILPYTEVHMKGGTFDKELVIQWWLDKEQDALNRGFEGLRLAGNTFWIEQDLWDAFTDYEETVNDALEGHRIIALCQYSLGKCSGSDVTDVIQNHGGTIIKKGTTWSVVEDVAHRKDAERIAKFPEENPNPVMRLNAEGEIFYANKPGQRLLDDWNGATEVIAPQLLRDAAIEALSNRANKTIEVEVRSRVYDFFVAPIVNVGYANFYGRDVTERKLVEENLNRELAINTALAVLYVPLISPTATMNEMTNAILDQARHLTDSEYGYVSLIDPDTGDNVGYTLMQMMREGQCDITSGQQKVVFPIGSDGLYPGLWGHALNTKEAFYTNAAADHPASAGVPEGHVPLEQFLSVPALIGEELVGQIALANSNKEYTDQDVEAIQRLAEFYSLAIVRMRMEQGLQKARDQLEQKVKERTSELQNEIEERKKAEQMYHAVFDGVNDAIFIMDGETGAYLDVNDHACEMFGYTFDELQKLSAGDLSSGSGLSTKMHLRDVVAEVWNTATSQMLEWEAKDKSGRMFWVESNISRAIIGGRPCILSAVRDITQRKKAEEELRATSKELRDNVEDLKRAEQSIKEHARTVDILNRVIRAGNEADELQTMLSSMLDTAVVLMRFDGGTIYSLNEAQHSIELQYQRGYPPEFVKRQLQHVSLTQQNIARIYKGESLFSEDYVTDAVEGFNPGDIIARAAIPLIARDSVIGHYTLFSRHRHHFTPEERELLVMLGRESATVIAKMQAELEVKEQLRLIDLANDAIIILDTHHHALSWNKGAESIFGWTKGEAIGQRVSTLLQTEFPVSFDDAQEVLMRDGHWEGEMRCITKNGERIVLEGSWTLKRDDAGNPTSILSIGKDVTERKQAETKIARLNRLYTVLSRVNETMWRIREPKKLYEEACRIVVEDGLFRMAWIGMAEPGTLLVKPIAHWGFEDGYLDAVTISAEDVPEGRGPTGIALREGKYNICNDFERDPRLQIWRAEALKRGYRSSAAFPLRIGTRVIGALTLYANEQLFFDDEEIQLIERLADDVAFAIEFIEQEEGIRAASLYSRNLLEASLDPLVTISAEGKITDVNKATEEVTGYSREQLIGSDFSSYFTKPEKARKGYEQVFKKGFVRDYPLAIRHTSGKITDVLYNATVYRNEVGEIQGVFAAARDITEREKAQEALKRAHDALEQKVQERTSELQEEIEEHKVTEEDLRATTEELQELTEELTRSNKELEQFAYIASHDLQEPLRTVTSSMGLLEKGYKNELGEDADMFITYAVDGAKQMQQLIKDLLEYSRVTSRGETFKPVHCEGVVQHAIDNLKTAIEESGVKIRLPEESLPMIMGDKTQLIQLFQNLIGNAIKFRSEQPPEVQIGVEPDGGNMWQFSIKDNGIGMDMQYADKIFTIFQRLNTAEEYEGTGVGLALCKKIVERHDGRIWVESKLGKGSTFYFTLPA